MERIEFPAAIAAYFLVALVLPTFRVWRRHGTWPVVFHREANPVARAMGLLFGGFLMALMTWAILYWRVGPVTLGVWDAPGWVAVAGWICITAGTIITVVAQRQMGSALRIGIDDRRTDLVADGLFAWSRNPIFSGMILTLIGAVLIAPALWSAFFAAVTIMIIVVQVRFEEEHLAELHGERYIAYAQHVGRFVPGVGMFPKSSPGTPDTQVHRDEGESKCA